MATRLGIDLGTTYSTVSYLDHGRVETIDLDSADSTKTMPSVVYYPETGAAPAVGMTARRQAKLSPERVVSLIKRQMGQAKYRHPGTGKSPVEVSADILTTLAREAREATGEDFREALITVPAYFGEFERADTKAAGERAGLRVVGLLPEPYAAALAYSVEHALEMHNRHLLVFDLGGGTFDVTLIHAQRKADTSSTELDLKTLEKDGDSHLGGADWDEVLLNLLGGKLQAKYGIGEFTPLARAALLETCEAAKRDLSRVQSKVITGESAAQQVEVTRAAFEKAARDLTFRAQQCLQAVLYRAERTHRIDKTKLDVLLCGGATKLPMIREMIREVTGTEPLVYKNPELLVSIGAAYWTGLSQGHAVHSKRGGLVSVTEGALTDFTAIPIGVGMHLKGSDEYYNQIIIPANSYYDGTRYDINTVTRHDNQEAIRYVVFEGSSRLTTECKELAAFEIHGLPKKPKGEVSVLVRLGFDRDGVITGYALHKETGLRKDVSITRDGRGGPVFVKEQ